MKKKTLLISSWNIQGHTSKGHDKFSDPDFIAHVKDSDIITKCIDLKSGNSRRSWGLLWFP
jgi:hypothetical protein